jgi:hypothetical protein
MSNLDINSKFIYINLLNNIRSIKNTLIEDDDIIFLFSIDKEKLKEIVKDESGYPDKSELKNRKILGSNIYTDFYKLIRIPSFFIKLQQLFSISDPDIKQKSLNLFNTVFKTILMNDNKYPSLVDEPSKNAKNDDLMFNYAGINGYNSGIDKPEVYFHNLVLNGYHEDNKPIVPKMLLSLYLEACIYMYHELINPVKNTFEHSISINNIPNQLEFKNKIIIWLKNRLNVINCLNSSNKKLYVYKKNGAIYELTDNFMTFEYFDLSYYYSSDEIIKIKSLCYLRTESYGKRRDETNEMIDIFFKNPLFLFVNKVNFDDKNSIEFLIFQAVHTYDQIINQLVQTRYDYLVSMRSMLSNQKNIDDEIEKIITSLQMYINYPFCFQYKFSDIDTCKYFYSEETMKILFEKYLKLALVYSYCEQNDIDIFKQPPQPPQSPQLNDMSSKTIFIWDEITEQNNRNRLRKILVKINESSNDMLSYLPSNTDELSDKLKDALLLILKNIIDSPMKTLHAEYLGNFKKVEIDGYINNFDTSLASINKMDPLNTSKKYIQMINNVFGNTNKFDEINEKINKYNDELDYIKKLISSIIVYQQQLFKSLETLQNIDLIPLKSLIDNKNDNTWTIGNTFNNENKALIDSNDSVDYNTVIAKKNNLSKKLENIQYNVGSSFGNIKAMLKELKKLINSLESRVTILFGKRDEIIDKSKILNDDLKLSKKPNIESLRTTLQTRNTRLVGEITTLDTEISILDARISVLNAKKMANPLTFTPSEQTELENKNAERRRKDMEKTQKQAEKDMNQSQINYYSTIIESIDFFVVDPELIKIKDYKRAYDTHFISIAYKITQLKNIFDTDPINKNYTELISNLQIIFYGISEFSTILQKNKTLNYNLDPTAELHQVKCEMFNVLNVINNNYLYKRTDHNGRTVVGDTYLFSGISHKSVATMMMINQLFKNNKGCNNSYNNVKTDDFTLDTTLDNSKLDKTINLKKFSTYFENKLEGISSTNFQNKYKISEKISEVDTNNMNSYQLIDYFNKNSILGMGEKLYYFLVANMDIEPLPDIDIIIDHLRGNSVSDYDRPNVNKLNTTLLTNKYDLMYDNNYKNIDDTDIELFLNRFSNVEIQNNIKDVKILPNDNHNRIMFDLSKIFDLINKFDENKFIKNYFKEIRDANVLSSANMSEFKHKIIPYDDLFYYRQNINFNYVDIKKSPFYYGFFSLGNLCDFRGRRSLGSKIEEYSNKLNEVAVQIIEYTNGML